MFKENFNKNPGGSDNQYARIAEAKNFDELFATLDEIGGVQGSHTKYSAEDLKRIVNGIQGGTHALEHVTRTGGLREKVEALLSTPENEAEVPAVGDNILLKKRSAHETSSVAAGESMEGILVRDIRLGESVFYGTGNTSPVKSMRLEGGVIVIETKTSVYEIRKK